jgi:predicted enzyme related to lactoylglutathione lyase
MSATVNYFEVGTPSPEESQRFYGGLFGWAIGEPSPVGYRMVDGGAGGLWDTTELGGAAWGIFYVQVDDVQATIAAARSLGAEVLVPMVDNGAIEFAHLADPHGNRFGIWRPKTPES